MFAASISILVSSTIAQAQERPWEVSLALRSFNTYYQENFKDPENGNTEDLQGNAWTAVDVHPAVTYRARQELSLPLTLGLEVRVPALSVSRLEVGHENDPSGTTFTTQKEQVIHDDLSFRVLLGWELLPFLQPFAALERSKFSTRRTGQQDGTSEGTFLPDTYQDYTETVYSTQLGFGVQGTVPLRENADMRIRYEAGYEVPQSVFVNNTSVIANSWGQGTSGYTLKGRVQFDMPFHAIELLAEHDGYVAIGALLSKRYWKGDGRTTTGLANELPATVAWPENFAVQAGGFIGIGMFF